MQRLGISGTQSGRDTKLNPGAHIQSVYFSFLFLTLMNDVPNWFAVQVRPKYERLVDLHLRQKGFESFPAFYTKRSQWSDRIKNIQKPLFPGYVFCPMDIRNRLPVLITPGVVRIVGHGAVPVPVRDEEIEAVQRILSSCLHTEPCAYLPKRGELIRLRTGPLTGLQGVVEESKMNHRLIVSVSLLQRSISVEVDTAWI